MGVVRERPSKSASIHAIVIVVLVSACAVGIMTVPSWSCWRNSPTELFDRSVVRTHLIRRDVGGIAPELPPGVNRNTRVLRSASFGFLKEMCSPPALWFHTLSGDQVAPYMLASQAASRFWERTKAEQMIDETSVIVWLTERAARRRDIPWLVPNHDGCWDYTQLTSGYNHRDDRIPTTTVACPEGLPEAQQLLAQFAHAAHERGIVWRSFAGYEDLTSLMAASLEGGQAPRNPTSQPATVND